METIILKTTWSQILPIMLDIQRYSNSEGAENIRKEFERMARLADLAGDLLNLIECTLSALDDLNVDLANQDEELIACMRADLDIALTNAGRTDQ